MSQVHTRPSPPALHRTLVRDRTSEPRTPWAVPLTLALALTACASLGFRGVLALDRRDTNHLETPLALSIARQWTEGPSVLYGPFSAKRPLVLIHAPLYYRIAGALGWPLVRFGGFDPADAALLTGRLLALGSTLALMFVLARLARIDGAPVWAAVWSALAFAGTSLLENYPVTVRPDLPALLFQTLGAFLVLRVLFGRASDWSLTAAYAAFALAFCTKQHLIASAVVSSLLLTGAAAVGRVRLGPVLVAHGVGMALATIILGIEFLTTDGRWFEAAIVLPRELRWVQGAGWRHVIEVNMEVLKRSAGLGLLGAAALIVRPRAILARGLDAALIAFAGAELVLTVPLCLGSQGAWTNYALSALVYAAVLTGRLLARTLAQPPLPAWRMAPLGLAALAFLASDLRLARHVLHHRAAERAELVRLLDDPSLELHERDHVYFSNATQLNREFGRVALTHDEWLYAALEQLNAAEPRSVWLKAALTGPVDRVVVAHEPPFVLGVNEPLPDLGYRRVAESGRYRVWRR